MLTICLCLASEHREKYEKAILYSFSQHHILGCMQWELAILLCQ